jgi:DNA-binding MarR family transcriptional regulator
VTRHPRQELDPLFTRPVLLSVAAALSSVDEADFATVRDAVDVSSPTLSKTIVALEETGYLSVRKTFIGRRPRTYLALTARGRAVLKRHVAALWEIAGPPP